MHRENKTDNKKEVVYKFGELFCGPGGLALGAKTASIQSHGKVYKVEHAWANDIDPDACSTYRRNICPENPDSVICGPVEDLDFSKLGGINAFAFGFPSNDFSMVGKRKGVNGKYGPLYTYGVRALDYFKPEWFFAEIVSGLNNIDNGRVFNQILEDLEGAGNGYDLTAHLYKFEDYGIPQCRHRIIIIGIDKKLKLSFNIPAPTTQGRPKTAREALELPPIPKDAPNNELTKQLGSVVERLRNIPPGENAWCSTLAANLRLNVKGDKMSQIYRRLHPDKPSYTITGSGGGGTHGYHWCEPRALTNRERARLQTFPDAFIFEGSKEKVRKQIGMAVPPLGAEIITEAVLKTFAGVDYKSVPAKWLSNGKNSQMEFASLTSQK